MSNHYEYTDEAYNEWTGQTDMTEEELAEYEEILFEQWRTSNED